MTVCGLSGLQNMLGLLTAGSAEKLTPATAEPLSRNKFFAALRMSINSIFGITLAVISLSMPLAEAAENPAQRYLTITRYQLPAAYQVESDREIAVNSVLRIPKWNRMCISVVREVTYARPEWDVPEPTKNCDVRLRDFLWEKRSELSSLWSKNSAEGNDDGESVYPSVFLSRLNGTGKLGIITRNWHGGSGGNQVEWSIYIIKESAGDPLTFPVRPSYMGTEVQPGGNVWFQSSCRGSESYENCARRLFFPTQRAVRLVFGVNGARNESVGQTVALPLEDGDDQL